MKINTSWDGPTRTGIVHPNLQTYLKNTLFLFHRNYSKCISFLALLLNLYFQHWLVRVESSEILLFPYTACLSQQSNYIPRVYLSSEVLLHDLHYCQDCVLTKIFLFMTCGRKQTLFFWERENVKHEYLLNVFLIWPIVLRMSLDRYFVFRMLSFRVQGHMCLRCKTLC